MCVGPAPPVPPLLLGSIATRSRDDWSRCVNSCKALPRRGLSSGWVAEPRQPWEEDGPPQRGHMQQTNLAMSPRGAHKSPAWSRAGSAAVSRETSCRARSVRRKGPAGPAGPKSQEQALRSWRGIQEWPPPFGDGHSSTTQLPGLPGIIELGQNVGKFLLKELLGLRADNSALHFAALEKVYGGY